MEARKKLFIKRAFFRKTTSIMAIALINGQHPVLIKNLSLGGMLIEFTRSVPSLKEGDKLKVNYQLDKKPFKEYSEEYKVVWTKERLVGLELIHRQEFQKEKGFYVRP